MPELRLRNVDPALVAALRACSEREGKLLSVVHREILKEALIPRQRNLAAHLLAIPKVGHDDDFRRLS